MRAPHIRTAVASVMLCCTAAAAADDIQIYFSSYDNNIGSWIERVSPGQPEVETIYQSGYDRRPQMMLLVQDHLYWTTYYPGEVWRSGPDGQDPTLLVDQGQYTTARAIEYHDGKIYWANEPLRSIFRANLDGTDVETVVSGDTSDYAFWDFTIVDDRIYWTQWGGTAVRSIGLDGTGYQEFEVPGTERVFTIESVGSRLYISDAPMFDHRILAIDPDGGNLEVIHASTLPLYRMDIFGDRIYIGRSTGPDWDISSTIFSIPTAGGDEVLEFEGGTNGYLWQARCPRADRVVADCGLGAGCVMPGAARWVVAARHEEPQPRGNRPSPSWK